MLVFATSDCLNGNDDGDCKYPGECGRYIDENNDKICDHSISPNKNEDTSIADSTTTDTDDSSLLIAETHNNDNSNTYHFLPILLILTFLYATSILLVRKKIISIIDYRKVWNILLLVTFLISGILGILLIVMVNRDILIRLPFNILFWHVEIGIAMFVICVFHIIDRWNYFKNIFKKIG